MTPDQILQVQVDAVRDLIETWRMSPNVVTRAYADEVAAVLGDPRIMV